MALLNLTEVFVSIQGEGPYIGTKQVFVRLAGCNLSCSYCDTSWSWNTPERFTIELDNYIESFTNPIDANLLAEIINKHLPYNTYAISITGGEPLLQAQGLRELLIPLKERTRILLETNGTLFKQLKDVITFVDIVSMDIKMPQYSKPEILAEHQEFLKLATSKATYVKLVVNSETHKEDILEAAHMIAKLGASIPVILQPLTKATTCNFDINELYTLQSTLLEILPDVRIIPQIHKLLGIK